MKSITGQIIQQFRLSSNFSQDELVDKIDISKAFLSEIETGKKMPSLVTIFRLAKGMNVNAWEIVKQIEETIKSKS